MNLKRASIGATVVLPVAMAGLLVRHAPFAARPGNGGAFVFNMTGARSSSRPRT